MNNEKRFYEALENIFVGAPIEGEGGYVNLLKIKEKYYRGVVSQLNEEINNDNIITDEFKNNFYDMLYNFFEKYFSECGSVYFAKTANWQRVYEKVYDDNKDVVLFWKTHMLYYVKSDILFQSIHIKSYDEKENVNYVFYFDVGVLKQKQNNEKKELVFSFKEVRTGKVSGVHDDISGDKTFVLTVGYSERGRKTDVDAISRETGIRNEFINKAISAFKKQTTVDFFINKNAKVFLEEQLELFLHQYLLDDTMFDQNRLNQIKTVQKYAKKLIAFISQFENELVRIWNKPKFVKNSNYVITIDKLTDALVESVMNSNGLSAQIDEWVKLGFVDEGFVLDKKALNTNLHLPIDTKYFKELEIEILSMFDNLDKSLDGRLIHSENYQALNTIKKRYNKQIKSVYIDPPFNTGNDFAYMDEYQDSSWLSIMQDRVALAHSLLSDDGSMFLHLDHFAEHRGREVMDQVFEKESFINNLAWAYRSGGASDKKTLPYKHDSILFYAKNKSKFSLNPIRERQYMEKAFIGAKKDEQGRYYSDTLLRDVFEGVIYDPDTKMEYNVRKVLNLSDEFYSFKNSQKPEGLLHLLLTLANLKDNEYVLDFFVGSGPSMAVSKKLGKKFIGIEMGEHFNNFYQEQIEYKNSEANRTNIYKEFDVISACEDGNKLKALVNKVGLLGRLKEVLACQGRHEPCGITKNVEFNGGGFFKYYELEQYEDTLNCSVYSQEQGQLYAKDVFNQYVFFADEKLADVLIANENDEFELNFDKLCANIDFPETLSLLYGKPIERITANEVKLAEIGEPIKYNVNNMTSEEKLAFVKVLKPLLWWGE